MAHVVATMIEILEQYQHLDLLDFKNQIESFLEKARGWRDVLFQNARTLPENEGFFGYTGLPENEVVDLSKTLWYHLIDAVHKAEDVIEGHIRNQILQLPLDQEDNESTEKQKKKERKKKKKVDPRLTKLVQEFELLIKEATQLAAGHWIREPILPLDHLTSKEVPWYPKLDPHTKEDVAAIFDDVFQNFKARLIQQDPSKLKIIAINGNPGGGKRTLARRLFNDPLIASHFRTRAWVPSPISKNERSCLLNLLEGLGMLNSDMYQKDVNELTVSIRNYLKYLKYFIVIQDVFCMENLVTFRKLFRDYAVGARILFTTFQISGETLSTYTEAYQMPRMTHSESWLLLRQKVFGRGHCPDKLEQTGKDITKLCRRVPQVVSLVAGVLATSKKRPTTWKRVAKTLGHEVYIGNPTKKLWTMRATLIRFIYHNMPYYLKPCLLYVGAFYETRDIKASKLIKLWIAEGFVKQSEEECLEDVADKYLNILIDKNLIYCTNMEPNGRVKAIQTNICLRSNYWWIANSERFFGSKYLNDNYRAGEEKLVRRVSVHGSSQPFDEMELPLNARSFLSVSGASRQQISPYLKSLTLLRVLELLQLEFYQFPMDIMKQVLLRYLTFSCHSNISNSFVILRNLQTLIIGRLPAFRAFSLPSDLWGLTQVRHVKCKETFVLIYPKSGKEVVHENLQTLSNMQLYKVRNQFLEQIPNIRNMGIFCNVAMEIAFDLACLDKLDTLKCSSDWSLASRNFLTHLTLPQSMKKLNLSLCRIPSEFMKVVGSLPNLEILKLQKSDFTSSTVQSAPSWETAEGEFPLLVSLEMLELNLVHWRAKATHLPQLKRFVIQNCYAMVEIPFDIGNIQTLELLQVNETSPCALVSAMQIKKEQEGRGNKFLQVRTHEVV